MPKKRNKGGRFSGLTYTRKIEIAGILVMAIAGLLFLSIVSHHPNDYGIVKSIPSSTIFSVDDVTSLRVSNWLGLVGAYISYFFVTVLFGYMSMILPILVFVLGWFVFRGKDFGRLRWPFGYGIWAMVLFSTFFGWFYNEFSWYSSVWSGTSGVAMAQILQNITGIGSIVILTVLVMVTLLVPVDRDLQKTVDAIRNGFTRLKERLRRKQEARQSAAAHTTQPSIADENRSSGSRTHSPDSTSMSDDQASDKQPDIDELVEQSTIQDLYRQRAEQEEDATSERPVASLEKRPVPTKETPDPEDKKGDVDESEEDLEISVFVGEGDEEAEDKALDRLNKDKAKEVPVIKYKFPTIDLLDHPPADGNEVDLEEIKENKRIILDKLKRHKIEILGINAIVGPTVTLYELEPAPDVKISKIQSYANDLKMATAAHGLRIIAPIPGRSAVGIEVPNSSRETVYIRSVLKTRKFVETDYELPVAFGKTIENEVFMIDLTRMPHLLMAGATGSGKSVGINTIITCLLYKCHPDDLKFVMIDPKKIELSLYRNIQNHFLAVLPGADEPIVTDTSRALETLQSVCKEMDERYELLRMAMVRDVKSYNKKFDKGELDDDLGHRHLPYIVVIIDELADLMMTAGKQIEEPIARLAQLARAIGIHLVVATQRPSVNVITGTIKANFPARIAYQVASKVDSRTILDVGGADQLVGRGDLLFTNGGGMTRLQNAFVSTEEVDRVTAFVGNQAGYKQPFLLPVVQDESGQVPDPLEDIDELFEAAAKVVLLHQQGSVSLLQRKLKIGYNRAGRIVDQLFNAGVVGPYQGSSARDVLIETDEELQEILNGLDL
ncbi:MAG: DNA translocase FtsK [Balneolaceae bacterium]